MGKGNLLVRIGWFLYQWYSTKYYEGKGYIILQQMFTPKKYKTPFDKTKKRDNLYIDFFTRTIQYSNCDIIPPLTQLP